MPRKPVADPSTDGTRRRSCLLPAGCLCRVAHDPFDPFGVALPFPAHGEYESPSLVNLKHSRSGLQDLETLSACGEDRDALGLWSNRNRHWRRSTYSSPASR